MQDRNMKLLFCKSVSGSSPFFSTIEVTYVESLIWGGGLVSVVRSICYVPLLLNIWM